MIDSYNALATPGLSDEELALLDLLLEDEGIEVTEQRTILPRAHDAELPLSFAQERLWFLDQWEPGTPAYNISFALRLIGQLHVEILARTIDEIVRRHETLRTTFTPLNGHPVQVIASAETAAARMALIDLRDLPTEAREAEMLRLAKEAAQFSFDLARGPLLRTALLRLDEAEYVFLLTIHHIISDGWSNGVLQREIVAIYTAFRNGQPSPLAPLPIQYADFALWQRNLLQGELLEQHLSYWQRQLANLDVLELPTDHPRPPVQTNSGAHHYLTLPTPLAAGLNAIGKRYNVTLFMTLLAAFQTLLARYSRQDSIAVGSPIANRDLIEVEPLIGFFINTLILRADLGGNPRFGEFLAQVRELTLEAYAHQNVPFEQLVELLRPQRDPSRPPLFQAMFVLQNVPLGSSELPDVQLVPLKVDSGISKFDLMLVLIETPEGLRGNIEYNTDLFEPGTIARMAANFQTLLEGIAANPERRIGDLPLLSADEHRLLIEWNATTRPIPAVATIQELIGAQAAHTPDAIAIVFDETNDERRKTKDESADQPFSVQRSAFSVQSLTYAELDQRANQLAHHLRSRGVGPEVCVGVCVERSCELIVALLGVLKAGGAYVPLDPTLPPERLAFVLRDAQVRVLITTDTALTPAAAAAPPLPRTGEGAGGEGQRRVVNVSADRDVIARQPATAPEAGVMPDNLAYIIYTSGSTGQPKGVMIPHGNLVKTYIAWQEAYELRAGQRHLQMANATFDVFTGDLARALCSGGTLVLCPRELLLASDQLCDLIHGQKIDCAEFVPAVLRPLLRYLDERELRLDTLGLLTCGSDSWYIQEYQHIRSLCGPDARVVNSFGVTEATIDSTWYAATTTSASADQLIPIGRPFANTSLHVLDPRGQPAPIGVPGELYLGGLGLARGYLGRPDLTAERFVPNPFAEVSGTGCRVLGAEPSDTRYPTPDTRLYKTGDRARFLPDGNLEFIGRIDNQVKLRGFRVELNEIEAVLMQYPAVDSVAVVVRESAAGNQRLVAYVVPSETLNAEGRTMNEPEWSSSAFSLQPSALVGELRTFLKARLPDYMVPASYVFLEALPLTSAGKIDRRALPAPDTQRQDAAGTFVAPREDDERRLAQIWEELLEVRPIGVTDNFFDLGGHSLLAVRLVSQIQQQFGQRVPLAALFQAPTVEQLARRLRESRSTEQWSPVVALRAGGGRRPFFCIHPAGGAVLCYAELARLLGPDQPFYGLQARGLEDGQEPHADIPAMAAEYLAALRTVQPNGPYLLGGWSLGGTLAFELARQLHLQGEQIDLLAIIDTGAPIHDEAAPDDAELASLLASALGVMFSKPLSIAADELRPVPADARLDFVLARARGQGVIPSDVTRTQLHRLARLVTAQMRALQGYTPASIPVRVTLFQTSEAYAGRSNRDLAPGWHTLALDGVELHDMPGNHYTVVRQPYVQALAEKLGACLEAALM